MTVARPHHACVPLCGCQRARSSPLGANTVGKPMSSFSDALFNQGLTALMPPTICCVRAQSVRDFVTEISGGATEHRWAVRCGSELEL